MGSWFDGLLGAIQNSGVDLPVPKGLNFTSGLRAVRNTVTGIIDVSSVAVAADYAGRGLLVDENGQLQPQPRPRLWLHEERFAGCIVSPSIGTHGWTVTGDGTPTISRQLTSPSVPRLRLTTDSGASSGDAAALHLGPAANSAVLPPALSILQRWQAQITLPALTSRRVFWGWADTLDVTLTPGSALGLLYDSSVGPNWYIWARSAGSGAPIDSGVAAATGNYLLTFTQGDGSWLVSLGATSLGELSADLPASGSGLNFGLGVETLTTATAAADLGANTFSAVLESSVWDDDEGL